MNDQMNAGESIHAGDGGYSEGNKEDYEAFVKVRNKSLAEARIREIVKEAGISVYTTINVIATDKASLEKFVELIVKECAEVADNSDATREKWQSIGKFVREHFGVEE